CSSGDVCANCSKIETLYEEFQTKYPGIKPDSTTIDSTQIAANLLFDHFMNYRLGFSLSTDEYLAFMSHCAGKLNYSSLVKILKDAKAQVQSSVLGYFVDFITQEGEVFTDLHQLEHNGQIQLPDTVRSKPGMFYNNVEFIQTQNQ